ncbi:vesicle-mediated transport [Spatholobus suberectus]|nr:vesicle-mediated transport [Spatholobus suberectus]
MEYYSNDPNADRLNRLKGEMTQVRTVMIDNIEKVLERGGRLELLVEKTSTMNSNSIRFKRQSRRYKNNLWWSNVRLTVALIIIFVIFVYIILAFICHGPLLASCWR